ncbi:uncharacterized protein BDZ99DRAFT_465866 [Mytilinidion resinicola]|uniref:Mediator of RNA polymerase II transcription subunit 20 n=1 Tax=Mytilinidion resinicola TaxID=574789 RepID=A0A6A6YCB0_9PEZI|nr:uncharacterized protein BDZ99DRAFT_465866 [Mytilinidion resinicola]KAF2806218.1 hypothetical protein BDZ99DRAFT_465866 [Mytilinidion resinicola]
MKVCGLYYVAGQPPSSSAPGSSTFQEVVSAIHKRYTKARPLPPWNLAHNLSRSTPATSDDPTPRAYHHALNLSFHPGKTFLYIHPPPIPGVPMRPGPGNAVVAIPATQTESFNNLLSTKFSALWTPKQSLSIRDGHAYGIGELIIRVGEVKSAKGVGGNPPALHGVVVYIGNHVGDPNAADGKFASTISSDRKVEDAAKAVSSEEEVKEAVTFVQEMIKEVWKGLEVAGGLKEPHKEKFVQYEGQDEWEAAEMEVRMWCDILRLRA